MLGLTVKELINELKKFNEDKKVLLFSQQLDVGIVDNITSVSENGDDVQINGDSTDFN